jgi:DNA-3-methyladenine glycosylase
MCPLPRSFYNRDVVEVARELLGMLLMRRSRRGLTSGFIVETESYLADGDSACHAARGKTQSNRAMFGPPGRAYVYPIHSRYCLNAVTQPAGTASAVLIRAVEPLEGIELMRARRGRHNLRELTRGPGRLCEAFDIDRSLDRCDLTKPQRLWICPHPDQEISDEDVQSSTRIGVTSAHELPLRFFVRSNPFVSR